MTNKRVATTSMILVFSETSVTTLAKTVLSLHYIPVCIHQAEVCNVETFPVLLEIFELREHRWRHSRCLAKPTGTTLLIWMGWRILAVRRTT